jgi:hypothetical protein
MATGDETVAPLAGWQIWTPGEVGAEHVPLVEGTVTVTML